MSSYSPLIDTDTDVTVQMLLMCTNDVQQFPIFKYVERSKWKVALKD